MAKIATITTASALRSGADSPLTGKCFVTFIKRTRPTGKNAESEIQIEYQGHVLGEVSSGSRIFLVQHFEWAMGEPSSLHLVPLERMVSSRPREIGSWEFFEDSTHLRFWLEHGAGQHYT